MNKKICVFVGEISQPYQKTIAQTIISRANSLGYDVVFICNYGSYNDDILYAEGEKSCITIPDCSTFDGIIVAEDVFDIDGMPEDLCEILKKTATCPIVYLRSAKDDFYSITLENKASIELMVEHFINDHGFTDICYMSGKKGTQDATERLEGFLNIMAAHGIEVNDHMIFYGDYWRYMGEQAVDWFMAERTTYPQAIICANDYMALSICDTLQNRGVRVPEDVCVSGFDFLDEARFASPSLTSLEVDFVKMANRAVDTIHNVNCGKEENKLLKIPAKLQLMRSCGCGKQHEYNFSDDFLKMSQISFTDTRESFISVTEYQHAFGFDDFMAVAEKYNRFVRSDKIYICFNDSSETGFDEVENDSTYTSNMMLRRIFASGKPGEDVSIRFKRSDILPMEYWNDDKPNNICVFPIHFKNIVYGYCVAEVSKDKWFDVYTQGYFMMLATAIQNSDLQQKIEQLESIRSLYENDPLTGIYNRRGFEKKFKEQYNLAKNGGLPIGIASIDMDNLKTLNDTYGHSEGDKAIITLARALESVLKENEYCARMGGDEFSAIILIDKPTRSMEFKSNLIKALELESKKSEVKHPVMASIGICESSEPETESMFACLQIADKRMYEEKKGRKSRGN